MTNQYNCSLGCSWVLRDMAAALQDVQHLHQECNSYSWIVLYIYCSTAILLDSSNQTVLKCHSRKFCQDNEEHNIIS